MGGLLLLMALVQSYFASVYRIESGSMRPTLFGGPSPEGPRYDEWVLVRFLQDPDLRRFDLVVTRAYPGSDPLVKRVAGLPGETVFIQDGDLYIDGELLPPNHPRPAPIPVFDDRYQAVDQYFEYKRPTQIEASPWDLEADVLALDASQVAVESQHGLMLFHPDLTDSYLDRNGKRNPGLRQVNDGIIECQLQLVEAYPGAVFRFRLTEEGDSFEAVLTQLESTDDPERLSILRIVRWNPRTLLSDRPEERRLVLKEIPVHVPRGPWIDVHFSNIDNHLRFASDALGLSCEVSYDRNEPYPGRKKAGNKSFGNRVAFGGAQLRANFRRVRVLRDLFYTSAGIHGTRDNCVLPQDKCFLLGDNSAFSTDSRHSAPTEVSRIAGRPVAIVWPSFRWLERIALPPGASKP